MQESVGFALLVVFLAVAPVVAQDIREVPREATVIIENEFGRVAVPDNMNPYIAGQYLDWGMWQATQEALFYLNYETGEVIPWQASGYSFNDDKTEVTINIRDGVKWSDGTPLTAHDVVFTIEMLQGNPELQYSFDMQQWVASITAEDDHTVVMTLTRPNPRFVINYFSVRIWDTILIAPQHIWENVDPTTFNNLRLWRPACPWVRVPTAWCVRRRPSKSTTVAMTGGRPRRASNRYRRQNGLSGWGLPAKICAQR